MNQESTYLLDSRLLELCNVLGLACKAEGADMYRSLAMEHLTVTDHGRSFFQPFSNCFWQKAGPSIPPFELGDFQVLRTERFSCQDVQKRTILHSYIRLILPHWFLVLKPGPRKQCTRQPQPQVTQVQLALPNTTHCLHLVKLGALRSRTERSPSGGPSVLIMG